MEFKNCLEQIWEQLIATAPTRGRSMTTVKIGRARILMSSWEVTAFVSEDGPAADDLRRAVVARAMLTAATEAAKDTGNATGLDHALSVARVEVSRLQERVDVAKQAKDTEAAVNLGISTKRLLSASSSAESNRFVLMPRFTAASVSLACFATSTRSCNLETSTRATESA